MTTRTTPHDPTPANNGLRKQIIDGLTEWQSGHPDALPSLIVGEIWGYIVALEERIAALEESSFGSFPVMSEEEREAQTFAAWDAMAMDYEQQRDIDDSTTVSPFSVGDRVKTIFNHRGAVVAAPKYLGDGEFQYWDVPVKVDDGDTYTFQSFELDHLYDQPAALEAAPVPTTAQPMTSRLYSINDRVQHHNGAIGTVVVNDNDGWIGWTKDGDTSHTFTHHTYMTPYFDYDVPTDQPTETAQSVETDDVDNGYWLNVGERVQHYSGVGTGTITGIEDDMVAIRRDETGMITWSSIVAITHYYDQPQPSGASSESTGDGGPFGDGTRISTTHYQCARCFAIVDANIPTHEHALTCNAQRERMPALDADKLPCTGGRDRHEWYIDLRTDHMYCRQCGLKAIENTAPVAAQSDPAKAGGVKLSKGVLAALQIIYEAGNMTVHLSSKNGYAAFGRCIHRKSANVLVNLGYALTYHNSIACITPAGRAEYERLSASS